MPKGWNKGHTKHTHASVRKISDTMKRKRIDNFAKWREKAKKEGKIKNSYPEFPKDGDLAELLGVTLGDGTITKYERTEEIRIISNANNLGFVERYKELLTRIFGKVPHTARSNQSNCIRISLYEKHISERLGIPTGKRRWVENVVPDWILANDEYVVRYLRGLYEAEGCIGIHEKTSTYKLIFSNRNDSMLANVYMLLEKLGFHPHISQYAVQLSRREEVFRAIELLRFREY